MCVEHESAMCTAGMPRSRSVALEGRICRPVDRWENKGMHIQGASGIDARFLKFTKTIAENP